MVGLPKHNPELDRLLAKGSEQRYLTQEEILVAFHDADSDSEELDAFYRHLG